MLSHFSLSQSLHFSDFYLLTYQIQPKNWNSFKICGSIYSHLQSLKIHNSQRAMLSPLAVFVQQLCVRWQEISSLVYLKKLLIQASIAVPELSFRSWTFPLDAHYAVYLTYWILREIKFAQRRVCSQQTLPADLVVSPSWHRLAKWWDFNFAISMFWGWKGLSIFA